MPAHLAANAAVLLSLIVAVGAAGCRRASPPAAPQPVSAKSPAPVSAASGARVLPKPKKDYFAETFSGGSAVWTGTEIIIWDGSEDADVPGWRFDPATNARRPLSAINAPSPRMGNVTVWTGREMIIWGGEALPFEYLPDRSRKFSGLLTGARYNPQTDEWKAMSTVGASGNGRRMVVVWTGSEMLVWGGNGTENSGARYDPATDSWTPMSMSNGPISGYTQFTVWTGSEMIVWLGDSTADKVFVARYNPKENTWKSINLTGVPVSGFWAEAGVWTGQDLIVWAGSNSKIRGARYSPTTDTWKPINMVGAPVQRGGFQAVWTGQEMLIWGGSFGMGDYSATGRRYNPVTDSWTPMSANMVSSRSGFALVWTGSDMFIWGGGISFDAGYRPVQSIGRYNLATDKWIALSPPLSASTTAP